MVETRAAEKPRKRGKSPNQIGQEILAAKRKGLKVEAVASGGGCDANIFNKRGIECANLGTGMRAIHTVKEWLDVKDMYASAEMTLEIMRLNGEAALK